MDIPVLAQPQAAILQVDEFAGLGMHHPWEDRHELGERLLPHDTRILRRLPLQAAQGAVPFACLPLQMQNLQCHILQCSGMALRVC